MSPDKVLFGPEYALQLFDLIGAQMGIFDYEIKRGTFVFHFPGPLLSCHGAVPLSDCFKCCTIVPVGSQGKEILPLLLRCKS